MIGCGEVKCIKEPCANLIKGMCRALERASYPCKFYKPKSQWAEELKAMNERCSRIGSNSHNKPWGENDV